MEESCYTESFMLSITNKQALSAECRAERYYADLRYAECRYNEFRYNESHYAECLCTCLNFRAQIKPFLFFRAT